MCENDARNVPAANGMIAWPRGSRSRRGICVALTCLAVLLPAKLALGSEIQTYAYDALGRLVSTSIAGGPSDGLQTSTTFDPADNRTNYAVAGAPLANLSVANASVTEGGTAMVTVARSGSLAGAVTVNYATSDGSAVAPADYASVSGTVAFAAGETSKTIAVPTVDDSIYEGAEAFTVALSSPSGGASIAVPNATVTINDNEVVPQFVISNASVVEGGTAILTVTRSGATGSTVGVNYATANGSAIAPDDFTAASGTLTFSAGEISKTIAVSTVDDNVYEGTEAFTVNLSGATGGAIISAPVGTVSLGDNDSAPSFAISNASTTEGGSIVMTVTKSGAAAMNLSVTYATANGSAVGPGDYSPASGILTFLPGETSKTITIGTVDDAIYEASETFSVNLSGPSGGATISAPTGTATINDNDVAPSFAVSNVSVNEGDYANVTVTKSGATGVNATVSYATADGTAKASGVPSGNYQPTTGSLTFLPGETSKTIQISTRHDVAFNLTKYFNLTISAANSATISTNTAVISVLNIDPAPSFTVVPPTSGVIEGGILTYGIVLSGNLYYDAPLTINYSTSSGTATSGIDFVPTVGTYTFNSPSLVGQISVQTIQDTVVEPDETVNLTISSPNYGNILAAQTSSTIINDDIPPSTGPVANTDNAGNFGRCDDFTINPLSNDSDPGGHYPLSLISVATGTGYTRTISGNNVTFTIKASGTYNVQYVVANTIGGQATGIITFSATPGPACGTGGGKN